MKKIVVVGGVAGGASFAARMRRLDEKAKIIMFERGTYISFANCGLPYHIGETIKERENLIVQTPQEFKTRFNVDVRTESEVVSIDTSRKCVKVQSNETTYEETYDFLVLSPGAEPVKPPVPGLESSKIFTLRTIADMDRIKELIDNGKVKSAAVIGGGFIGLEMAENLRHREIDVTLFELLDQVFAPADKEMAQILHQHLLLNGIELRLNNGVRKFKKSSDGKLDLFLDNDEMVNVDIAIMAIGVKPDTGFVKEAGISVNERGAIIVDEHLRTSIEDVYAVGDAIEVTDFVSGNKVHIPLAGPANRQARIVADNIDGRDSVYKNTQGTAICKIFDLTAATTGLDEKNAKKNKIDYLKSYTHSSNHASYYPGAYPLTIKILFSPHNGKLLGAQLIGKDGVDKRIDVFAAAIRHGLTVMDLSELELSYAPPYGSAKDAVNMAGFTAENILNGTMPVFYCEDLLENEPDSILLDVRTKEEFEQGAIDGAINIPVDNLRSKLNELDKNKMINVYCQVGIRGYIAVRTLVQNGFRARNLSGGYKTYTSFRNLSSELEYIKPVSQSACSAPSAHYDNRKKIVIDACGLQCPGPIMKLKREIDKAGEGELIEIRATDEGFMADIPSWCSRTENTLLSLSSSGGVYLALIKKGKPVDNCKIRSVAETSKKTMVIFSDDFDKVMAAFIIANGAVATGSEVTLFFTFWGLNLLRKDSRVKVRKNLVEKMFGIMMPKGPKKVKLSKMNIGGIGKLMIQKVMQNKNVYSLTDLIEEARKNRIQFVACAMSMDIMGIKKEELIEGVEIGGVATYLEKADKSAYNLFI